MLYLDTSAAVKFVRREAESDALAASLTVIELDGLAVGRAVTVESGLGALDAIHLGSALVCRPLLRAFVCYDARLAEAARAAGLPVVAPRT